MATNPIQAMLANYYAGKTQNGKESISISELPAASEMNDADVIPVVQDGQNKKVSYKIFRKLFGGATDEQVQEAVNEWLDENGVQAGATEKQAAQIEENKTNISKLSEEMANLKENGVSDEQVQSAVNTYIDENGVSTGSLEWGVVSTSEIFGLSTEEEPAEPIVCTGITLDQSFLTFSDTDTTITLNATVTPFDTTDEIVWNIDNEDVATVVGGVVTPVANGNAIVTVTCGEYSTTCDITVNIIVSYAKAGLQAYYDFSLYDDGYTGEVEDLSGNGNVPTITGLENYTNGRNGILGGLLRVNGAAPTVTGSGTDIYIPKTFKLPYTVEVYANVRKSHYAYAADSVKSYSDANEIPAYNAFVYTTQYDSSNAGNNNGTYGCAATNEVGIVGPVSTPNAKATDIEFTVKGCGNEDTTETLHHLIYCVGANEQKIYLNGEKILSDTQTSKETGDDNVLWFFNLSLKADIQMIRVYNCVLTDEQAGDNYSNTISTYGGGKA